MSQIERVCAVIFSWCANKGCPIHDISEIGEVYKTYRYSKYRLFNLNTRRRLVRDVKQLRLSSKRMKEAMIKGAGDTRSEQADLENFLEAKFIRMGIYSRVIERVTTN